MEDHYSDDDNDNDNNENLVAKIKEVEIDNVTTKAMTDSAS